MTSKRPIVLSGGYLALDVVQYEGKTWLRAGGTAANIGANLAYLGWDAAFVGLIGDDDPGRMVVRDLGRSGVSTALIRRGIAAGTPIVIHKIEEAKHTFTFGCRSCERAYTRHRPAPADLADQTPIADVFVFDRPSAINVRIARRHAEAGRLTLYEPSTSAGLDPHKRAVSHSQIVKFSRERAAGFKAPIPPPTPEQTQIETMGAAGSRLRRGTERWQSVGTFSVDEVDTGGAGDWMTAALLNEIDGDPALLKYAEEALSTANAWAALSCMFPGARTLAAALTPLQARSRVATLRQGRRLRPVRYRITNTRRNVPTCPTCLLMTDTPSNAVVSLPR